ncbi:MAG: hypothetical protein NC191_07275 [Muribaculaceae bacterium]|nr:hypothetical protein [Muribaculaceae bacterium]
MNNKNIFIVISIILFVTVFALSLDVKQNGHSVRISSRDVELNNDSAVVLGGSDVNVKMESSNISGAKVGAGSKGVNFDASTNFSSGKVEAGSSDINYNTQDANYNSNTNIKYQNLDTTEVDNALQQAQNITNQRLNSQTAPQRRYLYKDIDWGTWKSNFVNKILDDSIYIRELDNYNDGDWLSYSFYVDKRGKISKISVLSPVVTKQDRDKVANLIKSYEYQDITLFPPNSKKSIVKVFAVMMLSSYTKKTNPKDFNERERVRIEL